MLGQNDTTTNRNHGRRLRAVAVLAVLVALSVAAIGCTDVIQRLGKEPASEPIPEGAHLRPRPKTRDLAISGVTFDPKPEKKEQMAGYVDYIFGGMSQLTVTATVVNKGASAEADVPVVARLYHTRSGGLPEEAAEQLAAEKRGTARDLAPGASAQIKFVFTGMSKYAQSTHMLMHVSVERATGDTDVRNNVSRTYFWSLLGE